MAAKKKQRNKTRKNKKQRNIPAMAAIAFVIIVLVILNISKIKNDSVVAVVNGEEITQSYVDMQYSRVPAEFQEILSKDDFLMQTLIPQILLSQEAKKKGISVSKAEADKMLAQTLDARSTTKKDFVADLGKSNMTYDEFLEIYQEQIATAILLNQTTITAEVSDIEVEEFYENNKEFLKTENGVTRFEDVKEQLRDLLIVQKQREDALLYVETLKSKANIKLVSTSASSFEITTDPICKDWDGRPIVRMFSTSTCPHCNWIKGTINRILKEYADAGKISAYHWELDTGDDLLTEQVETAVPPVELALFMKYSPSKAVPLYSFGCKYKRLGNIYEAENDLAAEEAEFRRILDELA